MGKNDVKKYGDFIKEATTDTNTNGDANVNALQNNVVVYNKYKNNITSMFNNAKAEDSQKISTNFENFINGLSETEKGASDMLRTLFSSEKIKLDIKGLEEQKVTIDQQIQQRMKDLKQMSDNLK